MNDDLQSIYDALVQAQDCIRGETPEDISDAEAREDTISKIRDAMRSVEAMLLVPAQGAPRREEALIKALKDIADHPESKKSYHVSGSSSSYGVGWAFWNIQRIARAALSALSSTERCRYCDEVVEPGHDCSVTSKDGKTP